MWKTFQPKGGTFCAWNSAMWLMGSSSVTSTVLPDGSSATQSLVSKPRPDHPLVTNQVRTGPDRTQPFGLKTSTVIPVLSGFCRTARVSSARVTMSLSSARTRPRTVLVLSYGAWMPEPGRVSWWWLKQMSSQFFRNASLGYLNPKKEATVATASAAEVPNSALRFNCLTSECEL